MVIFDGRETTVINPDRKTFTVKTPVIHTMEKNEDTGEWEETDKYMHMDDQLFNNLYFLKKSSKRYNGDILFVVDGEEGSGKSTLARQICRYLDSSFTHKNICYNTKDAIQLHYKLPSWSSILLDESREDLDRKSTMSKKSKNFNNFLSESRVANKFFCLVLPSIYDLDKYSAQHRAKFLVHCYKRNGYKPGYFMVFSKHMITKLFATGYKYRNYPVNTRLRGTFPNLQVVDMDEYNAKKMAAFHKYKSSDEPEYPHHVKQEIIRDFLVDRLYILHRDDTDLTMPQIAESFGYSEGSLYKWKREDERFNSLADKK